MSVPSVGASVAFADPRLKAGRAYPVWLPGAGAARLHFTAYPTGVMDAGWPGLRVPDLPNMEHVLVDTAGRQHLVLRSGASTMQLLISGGDGIVGTVLLSLCIGSREAVGTVAKSLAALAGILSSSHPPSGPPNWTAQSLRLRDALIALDGYHAGASLRDTAIVIYGRERIDRDWPDAGLRQRLRRDLHRGRALCAGGYRHLIR